MHPETYPKITLSFPYMFFDGIGKAPFLEVFHADAKSPDTGEDYHGTIPDDIRIRGNGNVGMKLRERVEDTLQIAHSIIDDNDHLKNALGAEHAQDPVVFFHGAF